MSTPTGHRRHLGVHRRPAHAGHAPRRPAPGDERPYWDRHHWIVPLLAVAAVVGAFTMMILLTALAGGSTPFTG